MNSEKAITPKPFVRKDPTKVQPVRGWSPTTVRSILCCEMYRGVGWWNRSRKRDDWREINPQRRPESEWVESPCEPIISEELWKRVQARRADTAGKTLRFADGRMSVRPPKTAPQNLIAGIATCGECGGSLVVETSARKRGRVREYVCYRRRHYGTCSNNRYVATSEMEEAVMHAIEEHVFTPEAIEQVVMLSERNDEQDRRDALVTDLEIWDEAPDKQFFIFGKNVTVTGTNIASFGLNAGPHTDSADETMYVHGDLVVDGEIDGELSPGFSAMLDALDE